MSFYPTLLNASEKERSNFSLMAMGTGITWPSLGIDLEVASIIAGKKEIPGLNRRVKKFKKENKLS